MKEELTPLEKIGKKIFEITADCSEIIPRKSEDGKVVYHYLKKLSTKINDMHLDTFNGRKS